MRLADATGASQYLCGAAVDAASTAVAAAATPAAAPAELQPTHELRTRAGTASAEAALADQVKALRPRGRIQRAVQLSMLSVAS